MRAFYHLLLFLILAHSFVLVFAQFFPKCTQSKTCVSDSKNCSLPVCADQSCNLFFTFRPEGEDDNGDLLVVMELYAKSTHPEKYVAVGFSDDELMGDDYVTVCGSTGPNDDMTLRLGRTLGHRGVSFSKHNHSEHFLSKFNVFKSSDDYVYCRFAEFVTAMRSKEDVFRPDIYGNYFIMISTGKLLENGDLSRHDAKYVTSSTVSLSSLPTGREVGCAYAHEADDVVEEEEEESSKTAVSHPEVHTGSKFTFVHWHGVLMIFAWLLCVVISVYTARYLRHTLNNSVLGSKLWFQIHRTVNIVAVLSMIGAGMAIGIARDFAWTGPTIFKSKDENLCVAAIHSLAGAIAVFAAVFQPFNALLRCDLISPNRSIFNKLHRSVGLIGLFFAFVALFLAVIEFEWVWWSPKLALIMFALIVIFGLLLVLISEVVHYHAEKDRQHRVVSVQLSSVNGKSKVTSSFGGITEGELQFQKMIGNRQLFVRKTLFGCLAGIFIALVSGFMMLILVGLW